MDFRKVYGLAQKSRLLGEEYEAFGADLGVDLSKRVFYDWVVVESPGWRAATTAAGRSTTGTTS